MEGEVDVQDVAIEQLRKHIDYLPPDVFRICVSKEGKLLWTFADPVYDSTRCPYYPPVSATQHPEGIQTVLRSDLEELDRIVPLVDLVRCLRSTEPQKKILTPSKLVFKYYTITERLYSVWDEMNLWMRLPKHPNIVPFDKIVVDELEHRCIGFTSVFIPGGTLEHNTTRVFKLKWLLQLIDVIDELNLNLGIAHQDVAPRNIVIDETTDSLRILDFNFSSRIGHRGYSHARNDIKGVIFTMYEIITRDDKPRSLRHEYQNVEAIEKMVWIKHPHVQLDHPVADFRETLRQWFHRRCLTGNQISFYTYAPQFIDWPDPPQPPSSEVVVRYANGPVTELRSVWDEGRTTMQKQGKTVLNWQRPPQCRLEPGDRLLETGEFIQYV
ncbi:hypothetical protein B0J13DRAFT_430467 [Dactylonectria estremocensis]|uniref:Protein kinase domain-containing protein n=1 Tax=Dactylonectria estremocensis TaxID=1079267 RepID=A0A9P9FID0_9HYPO|nr:hypothetical protein B0J13DRAFT_430467 [Dactylonectria estremocensis]